MSYKDQLRKTIIAPFSGISFEIRRISYANYMAELGILPLESLPSNEERMKAMQDEMRTRTESDPAFAERAVRFLLGHGIAKPKIWFEDSEVCPEEQVAYEDLEADVAWLIGEISQWSGTSGALQNMKKFFRNGTGLDPGHGGEALRPETVEPATEGNDPKI